VVPVMLPEAFSGFGKTASKGIILAGTQGARYGVAVDQDLGVVEGPDLTVLALPKLAAKPWLPAAALAKGRICLLVDSKAFADPEDTAMGRPIQAVFTPSSLFPAQFRKIGVAIVEFSLLGTRHAVPQEEMRDDLALLPIVPVPGTPEIVLGVAELRGELLPVLDLAALFGRRSPIGKNSRMMHIVNGDFQALVITGEVAGARLLPVETQRQVPIVLPHGVLYGCYLDAGGVRLILNVEALAVHFEKTAVREFVASLSPELLETSAHETAPTATIAPAQHYSVTFSELPAGSPAGASETDQEWERGAVSPLIKTVYQPGGDTRFVQDLYAETSRDEQLVAHTGAGDAAHPAMRGEDRIGEDARAEAAAEAAAREQERLRVEAEKLRAENEARSRAVEQTRLKAEADAKVIEEKRALEIAEKLKSETASLARAEAEARTQKQKAERQRAAEEMAIMAAADARKREEEAERLAAEQAGIAAAEAAKREADEARQRKEEAERRAASEALAKSRMLPEQQAALKLSPVPRPGEVRPAVRKRGKYIVIAALIAFFVIVIYFVSVPKRPDPPQGSSMPEKTGKQAATQKSAPQPGTEPSLYLTVPPSKAITAPFVYTVVKGDNLWSIAKRFTGNALSYPRVARDNSIAAPDLIFPGQKILLVQQATGTGPRGAASSSE